MIYTVSKALAILCPTSSFTVFVDEDNRIDWRDPSRPCPSAAEIQAKVDELNAAEPMRLLRILRDQLLSEVDWVAIKYFSRGEPMPANWSAYMQALRDLPQTQSPTLDSNGELDMSSFTLPTKPQ